MLRRNGIETPVDLRPQQRDPDYYHGRTGLQTVAFFTDTEHRVEPVESGVRIVLQYDIELSKKQEDQDKNKAEVDEKDDDEDEEEDYEPNPWMDSFTSLYSRRMEMLGVAQAKEDKVALQKVLSIIKGLHSNGTEEVAFALQHLYRSASILPQYLKGPDAILYDALLASGDFDVSLDPVIFSEESDYEGIIDKHYVYRYDDLQLENGSESTPPRKRQKMWGKENSDALTAFHIPKLSGIMGISSQDYVEFTGNEAVLAKYRYYGGGMFVRPKSNSRGLVA